MNKAIRNGGSVLRVDIEDSYCVAKLTMPLQSADWWCEAGD